MAWCDSSRGLLLPMKGGPSKLNRRAGTVSPTSLPLSHGGNGGRGSPLPCHLLLCVCVCVRVIAFFGLEGWTEYPQSPYSFCFKLNGFHFFPLWNEENWKKIVWGWPKQYFSAFCFILDHFQGFSLCLLIMSEISKQNIFLFYFEVFKTTCV